MIWLDRDLQWSGLASGKRGRPSLFSDAAIQFCLTIKSLFGLALRQAMGMFNAQARRPAMVGARLQHGLPAPEDAQGSDSVSASRKGAAPAG